MKDHFEQAFFQNPKAFTLSALILGYLLTGDLTAKEQNALGNWLLTVGQILATNATIQQYVEEKIMGNTININSKNYKSNGGSPYMENEPMSDFLSKNDQDVKELKRLIKELEEKLNNLSK